MSGYTQSGPPDIPDLQVNADINRVRKNIHPLCMDGRDCIRWVTSGRKEGLAAAQATSGGDEKGGGQCGDALVATEWAPPSRGLLWHHAVMNLPRTAVEFCDAFQGAFPPSVWKGQLPLVHCYTFQKSETEAGALQVCAVSYAAILHVMTLVLLCRCVEEGRGCSWGATG